jgi:oxygen-independent coproporphyrinogen-3 oxidase
METAVIQLRRVEGIGRAAFHAQMEVSLNDLLGPMLDRLVELELLTDDGEHVALTRRGRCVADAVIQEIMKAT